MNLIIQNLGILLLIICGVFGLDQYIEDADRFPGWKGTLPKSLNVEVQTSVGFEDQGKEVWRGRIEQLSWEPRAFLFHNFLSEEECDHLIELGKPRLVKSTVVDSDTGGSVDSDVRTSSGTFLSHHQDDIVARIEERIATVTMLPDENGESIQILRYVDGQKYEPHTDYFHDKVNANPSNGGQRIATVLMYLTTPEEGGETVFPNAEGKMTGEGWSDCAREGLAVKATKGNALLFYSLKPDGTGDLKSTHGSCPTLKGEKYSATKWIHVGSFRAGSRPTAKSGCSDLNSNCAEWANAGECTKNPGYMLETCALSCNACGKNQKLGRKAGLQ